MWVNVLQGSYKSLLWMDTLLKTKVWMLVTVIWATRVIKVGCLFAFFCFLLCSSVSLSVSWEEEWFSSSSTCSLAAFSLIFSPFFLLFLLASSSAFALLAFCLALPLREDEEEEEDIVIFSWFCLNSNVVLLHGRMGRRNLTVTPIRSLSFCFKTCQGNRRNFNNNSVARQPPISAERRQNPGWKTTGISTNFRVWVEDAEAGQTF